MGPEHLSNDPQIHSPLTPENGSSTGYSTLTETNEDGMHSLSVLVNGVHCAGCIQKIESTLSQNPEIKNVRLNFTTRRLALLWDGPTENADTYINTIENLGYSVQPYDSEAEQSETVKEERFLLLCLGVAGFAMGNIMLLSVGLWATTGDVMGMATRDFMHLISALIALPAILFSGRPFFRSASKALKSGHTNMDVPISLALILASLMSLFEITQGGDHIYFDSALMLMFFLLIGRYLDFRARKNARSAATNLLSSLTGFANVLDDTRKIQRIPIRDLRENMHVRVAAGEKFPVDGIITEGQSEIDTSLITGETMPRYVEAGSEIFAGTYNLSAPLTIKVAKAAENSLLADIVRLMEKAGQSQARYVRLADQAAKLYTPIVHTLAALAFLGWWLIIGIAWQNALMIAVTVLIITCPCALGLAVPVVQVLAIGRLTKNGILVKSGDALERLAQIDTILLDKTGTLTHGTPELDNTYDPEKLHLAASLATHSHHPLSKALAKACDKSPLDIIQIKEHPGQGLEGQYNGKPLQLGSRQWCGDQNAPASSAIELWLNEEGKPSALFQFHDQLRTDTSQTIELLRQNNLTPIMVSGDRETVAQDIADQSGIAKYYAEKTPPEKFKLLEELKDQGHKILMVGDGLNDAPVLAGADISMAPGTAIDMAQNAADIVFMGEKFAPVYHAWKTAKFSQKLVKQNFALAVLYNLIAIPLALAGLVTPLIAAIAMSSSSLIVIANSFRLRLQQ